MPWLAIIIFFVLVVVFYYLWRSSNERTAAPPSEDNMPQSFDFDEQDGVAALTRRQVTLVAAQQRVRGKRQKLRVETKALPDLADLKPPPEKKIDALLAVVVNPTVYAADTGDQVTTFDPPLTVTVHYKKEDAALTTSSSDGTPQLSLVTAYLSPDGWRFEKLPTTVKPNRGGNGGTLTAQVETLEPSDPVCIGKP